MTRTPVHHVENHRERRYTVVHRIPPLAGEPEWVVVQDGITRAESIAVFFNVTDASDYARWREESVAKAK